MDDGPIKPIQPIHSVYATSEIRLREVRSSYQLRQWMDFVKRLKRRGRKQAPKDDDDGGTVINDDDDDGSQEGPSSGL